MATLHARRGVGRRRAALCALLLALTGIGALVGSDWRDPAPTAGPVRPAETGSTRAARLAPVRAPEDGRRRAHATASDALVRRSTPAAPAPDAALLTLVVRDAERGTVVPGASLEVGLEPLAGASSRRALRADDDGRVALAAPAGVARVVAWSEGLVSAVTRIELVAGAPATAWVDVAPGLVVEGRVVDAFDGVPVPGARVSVRTHAELDTVRADAHGSFRHPRFPADGRMHQLAASAPGYGNAVRYVSIADDGRWSAPSPLDPGRDAVGRAQPARVEIALAPSLVVSGRALDAAGGALPGATVTLEGFVRVLPSVATRDAARAQAGPDGRFALTGVRADVAHALVVEHEGLAQHVRAVPAGRARRVEVGDVVLATAAEIGGVLVDPAGLPAEGMSVELLRTDLAVPPPDGAWPLDAGVRLAGRLRFARTDASGTFAFPGLPAGSYELSAHRGGRTLATASFALGPGARTVERLALAGESLVLEGRVVGPDGPAAGALVTVTRDGREDRTAADAEGRFRLAGLDGEAAYRVEAVARDASSGGALRAGLTVHAWERPLLRLDGP